MMQPISNLIKTHAISVVVMLLVAVVYFLPSFNGKTTSMEDVRQSKLTSIESEQYYNKEGEAPGWTNRIFGGMPNDLIFNGPYETTVVNFFTYNTLFAETTAFPFQNLFLCFIGFYVLLLCFNVNPKTALFGALAYGFMTFTFSSIEAAHVNKVFAMAMLPPVLGGFYLMATGRLLNGFVVFTYHFALQTYYFHYQITYYTLLALGVFGLFYFIKNIREKQFKTALMLVLLTLLGGGLSVVSNLQKISTTQDYSKYTMRGGSPLEQNKETSQSSENGLDKEYAFRWSYGIGETFTVLVPGLYGGSTQEKVTEKSPLYEKFQNPQILEQPWPLYHGDMPSTSGPVYFGAIVVFLFLLSFKLVQNPVKWPLYAVTLLALMMAWGKNFESFNYFLFDNLPFYNKFRTPMMAMSLAQVSVLLLAVLSLKEVFTQKLDSVFLKKTLLPVLYGVGGFLLLTMAVGSSLFGTDGVQDQAYLGQNPELLSAVKETRGHLMLSDSFRSLFFVVAAFGLIWFYVQNKIKKEVAVLAIGAFMVVDLVGVDRRYLNWEDFKFDKEIFETPAPDQVDLEILKDADPHYRVMDMSRDPFNTNDAAAFHKLVGGYHAAKLSRFQDFISNYIVPQESSQNALDMLNCKYIIGTNSQTNEKMYQQRPNALGNAWFVESVIPAFSEVSEMDSLKKLYPAKQAVINTKQQSINISEDISLVDSNAFIQLYSYHPDTLRYNYASEYQRFVVFSEVYYPYWKLYVNGKELPLYRVNYTLRGAVLPPGKGDVEMVYTRKPALVHYAETRYTSIFVVLLTLAWIVYSLIAQSKKQPNLVKES